MALPWVRLDTGWPHNPKFLMLKADKKYRAITAYMAGLAYAGGQGTAGFIPYYALTVLDATTKDANDLIAVSLWHPCDGGYQINDWGDYQESTDATERRRKKAQDAALIRWHGRK